MPGGHRLPYERVTSTLPASRVNARQKPKPVSTKPWRVLRYTQPKFSKSVAALMRHAMPDPTRSTQVAEIIAAVRH